MIDARGDKQNTEDEVFDACHIYVKCLFMAIISPLPPSKDLYKSGKIPLLPSLANVFFDINQFEIDLIIEPINNYYDP